MSRRTNTSPTVAACLSACLCAALLLAGSSQAQTAAPGHFDPRAHSSLDQVVMLCATEPGSDRFAHAWQQWLADNPDADVYAAVRSVISRSGTLRSMAVPGMVPAAEGRQPDPEAVSERMLSLAGKPRAR